jgi:hypothetical protein
MLGMNKQMMERTAAHTMSAMRVQRTSLTIESLSPSGMPLFRLCKKWHAAFFFFSSKGH